MWSRSAARGRPVRQGHPSSGWLRVNPARSAICRTVAPSPRIATACSAASSAGEQAASRSVTYARTERLPSSRTMPALAAVGATPAAVTAVTRCPTINGFPAVSRKHAAAKVDRPIRPAARSADDPPRRDQAAAGEGHSQSGLVSSCPDCRSTCRIDVRPTADDQQDGLLTDGGGEVDQVAQRCRIDPMSVVGDHHQWSISGDLRRQLSKCLQRSEFARPVARGLVQRGQVPRAPPCRESRCRVGTAA